MAELFKDKLCGNRMAHSFCRFRGEVVEEPITVGCKAPDGMYCACEYADAHGVKHQIARRQKLAPKGNA